MATSFNTVDLLKICMYSKSIRDNSKAFMGFAQAVIRKLDVSKFQSLREDKSFVYSFRYLVKVSN